MANTGEIQFLHEYLLVNRITEGSLNRSECAVLIGYVTLLDTAANETCMFILGIAISNVT